MRVIYTGDPLELERGESLSRLSTTIFGVTFPMSAEVDVTHLSDAQKRKLLNNSHFRPAGVDAPAVPLILPASAQAQGAERAAPEGDAADDAQAEAAEVAALQARLADKAKAKKKVS